MKLIIKQPEIIRKPDGDYEEGEEVPKPKFWWFAWEGENIGNPEAQAQYGDAEKIAICNPDWFNGPMSVKEHPTMVTSLRIKAAQDISPTLLRADPGNFAIVRVMLDAIPDTHAAAAAMGYNLDDWIAELKEKF